MKQLLTIALILSVATTCFSSTTYSKKDDYTMEEHVTIPEQVLDPKEYNKADYDKLLDQLNRQILTKNQEIAKLEKQIADIQKVTIVKKLAIEPVE